MAKIQKYAFLLGRNNELSYCEIVSYLKSMSKKFNVLFMRDEIAILEIDDFDFQAAIKKLAGTIKIAEIIVDDKNLNIENVSIYNGNEKKVPYSLEFYGENILREKFKDDLKKYFRTEKLKGILKTIAVHKQAEQKENILDLMVIKTYDTIYLTRTIAFSNPLEFKYRDEKRPYTDPSIMISIRLARILVNLSQAKPGEVLLDPFCGIGTILQEALIDGMTAYGVELDENNVKKAQQNIVWIKNELALEKDAKIVHGDAKTLTRYFGNACVDAVATEPYLGPLIKELPAMPEAIKTIKELEDLYTKTLRSIHHLLKKGLVVFIMPKIITMNNKIIELNANKILYESGFEIYNPTADMKYKLDVPIIYKEEWHKIERLIYILKKTD